MKALVIGAGNFGATAAVKMAECKCEVILIDIDADKLDDLKDQVGQVIVGDAKDKDLLAKFAKDMDVVIVSLGELIDSSVLITLHLRELKAKRIIAKAASEDHGKILKMIGAHQVVFPERDEAIRLVSGLVSPDIVDLMKISDDLNMIEIAVPEAFIGKSIKDLDLRKKFGLQVLAVKNPLKSVSQVLPSPGYAFQPDDTMIVMGEMENLTKISSKHGK